MQTIKQVEVVPVFVELMPGMLEEGKIYISKEYGVAIHNCLCGCGEKTVTPIGDGEWTLIEHPDGRISLTPSIGNFQMPCK